MSKENFGLDIVDAFARSFIYRTVFTKSPQMGLIGGSAYGITKAVSIVTQPIFDKMPYIGEVTHQFTRGVIIRTIYTGNLQSGLVLGATYAFVTGASTIFKNIMDQTSLKNAMPDGWGSEIYGAFWSELNNTFAIGIQEGAAHAVAKTVSLIFKKAITDTNPSDIYGLESAGVFVKGFVATTLLTANPVLGATNGALSLTAFHIHALYISHTR